MSEQSDQRATDGEVARLLRAALEKIVYFEWRISELTAELAAAERRCAGAENARLDAEESARAAEQAVRGARRQLAELEAERARLATLLARPAHAPVIDAAALEQERVRSAQLEAQLAEARTQLARNRAERERWMTEMIAQSRSGDEAPAALAQFISELRGEVIALRERQERCDALLQQHGIPLPAPAALPDHHTRAPHASSAVDDARRLRAEGRLDVPGIATPLPPSRTAPPPGTTAATSASRDTTRASSGPMTAPASAASALSAAMPDGRTPAPHPATSDPHPATSLPHAAMSAQSTAARALADQCLRGLQSRDPVRRAQAARHLAAVPSAAAAPVLAGALHEEPDAKARAQIARALAACGGETALELVASRLSSDESPLVRLAALDALAGITACADAALQTASGDPSPAVRRRAAALALSRDATAVLARLAADEDATVRAACAPGEASAPPPAGRRDQSVPPPRSEHEAFPATAVVRVEAAPASAKPPVRIATPPPPAAAPGDEDAILAVQSAMFGLTEDELAARTGLDAGAARALAGRLVAQGRLGRRGKRLVIAEGGAA